jgi:hypothetical protein
MGAFAWMQICEYLFIYFFIVQDATMRIFAYMNVPIFSCVHVHAYTCRHMCAYLSRMCSRRRAHALTRVHMHSRSRAHTHTHPHTRACAHVCMRARSKGNQYFTGLLQINYIKKILNNKNNEERNKIK